jgi:hypothetical protein
LQTEKAHHYLRWLSSTAIRKAPASSLKAIACASTYGSTVLLAITLSSAIVGVDWGRNGRYRLCLPVFACPEWLGCQTTPRINDLEEARILVKINLIQEIR